MANNAVINFLFNSQGAMRELNNFKQKFTSAIDAIENSGIGQFARLGSAIAGAFSIKSFLDYAKAVNDFQTMFESTPAQQIGKFVNSMRMLNRETTSESALSGLKGWANMWLDVKQSIGDLPTILKSMNIQYEDANHNLRPVTEIYDEFIQKARDYYHLLSEEDKKKYGEALTGEIGKYGFGEDLIVATKKLIMMDEDLYREHQKTIGGMYTPSEEDNKAAEEFGQSITLLSNAFERLGGTLAKNKFINTIIKEFTNAIKKFTELPEDTQNKILAIAGALMAFGPGLKILRAILPLINPFGMFVGLIASFALNLGGVRDKADEALKSWQSFIDEFKKKHELKGSFLQELHDLVYDVLHPIEALKKAWAELKREILGTDDLGVHGADLSQKDRERGKRILSGKATAGDYASGAWSYFTDQLAKPFSWAMNKDQEMQLKPALASSKMSQYNDVKVEVNIAGNANKQDARDGTYQGILDAFSDISGTNTSVLYGAR